VRVLVSLAFVVALTIGVMMVEVAVYDQCSREGSFDGILSDIECKIK